MAHRLPYFKNEAERTAYERIKKFLDSDSGYATAANVVLALAAISGILVVGAVAPNLVQILGKSTRGRGYSQNQVRGAMRSLNDHGFVKIVRFRKGYTEILLTNKGKKRIRSFCFERLMLGKPKRWDGKWRAIVFDVPVARNSTRIAFRNKLKELEFYQLQQSVWIYPYPCEDEILFVANTLGIENCVNVLTVEMLLHEEKLRKIFKLNE